MNFKNVDTTSIIVLTSICLLAVGVGALGISATPTKTDFILSDKATSYDLGAPDETFILPNKLNEISGLALWKDSKLFTVQDEEGKVYVYDTKQQDVTNQIKFHKKNDFEGIAFRDSIAYVLESDGDVYHFNILAGKDEYEAEKFETVFSRSNDMEGLCYDPVSDRLLILPKEKQLQSVKEDHLLGIYEMNPLTGKVKKQPAYTIDKMRLGAIIYGSDEPYLMKPSGLAVHPTTGHIYVIASVGKILVIIDRESNILAAKLLKKKIFPQPEGITFNQKNELFLSSEGKGKKASISRFSPIAKND